MATEAQIRANRENAAKSTGPKTPEGKAAASLNAQRHGFFSKHFVILPGQEQQFEAFFSALELDLQPQTPLEGCVFHQIVHAAWNIQRCHQAEAQLLARAEDPDLDPLLADTNEAKLRRIDTALRRSQAAFHRCLKELRAIQTERQFRQETYPVAEGTLPEDTVQAASAAIEYRLIQQSLRADARSRNTTGYGQAVEFLDTVDARLAKREAGQTKPIPSLRQ